MALWKHAKWKLMARTVLDNYSCELNHLHSSALATPGAIWGCLQSLDTPLGAEHITGSSMGGIRCHGCSKVLKSTGGLTLHANKCNRHRAQRQKLDISDNLDEISYDRETRRDDFHWKQTFHTEPSTKTAKVPAGTVFEHGGNRDTSQDADHNLSDNEPTVLDSIPEHGFDSMLDSFEDDCTPDCDVPQGLTEEVLREQLRETRDL